MSIDWWNACEQSRLNEPYQYAFQQVLVQRLRCDIPRRILFYTEGLLGEWVRMGACHTLIQPKRPSLPSLTSNSEMTHV